MSIVVNSVAGVGWGGSCVVCLYSLLHAVSNTPLVLAVHSVYICFPLHSFALDQSLKVTKPGSGASRSSVSPTSPLAPPLPQAFPRSQQPANHKPPPSPPSAKNVNHPGNQLNTDFDNHPDRPNNEDYDNRGRQGQGQRPGSGGQGQRPGSGDKGQAQRFPGPMSNGPVQSRGMPQVKLCISILYMYYEITLEAVRDIKFI